MKKRTIAAVLAAGAAVVLIGNAPDASAVPVGDTSGVFSGPAGDRDAQALWVDISDHVNGSASDDESFALTACRQLAAGYSEGDLIAVLAQPPHPWGLSTARFVVHASEWHYCPWYY